MEYFYTPPRHIADGHVFIDGEEHAHLVHVMRRKVGDHIRVVDGMGTAHDVTLIEVERRFARGKISGTMERHREPGVDLTLAVGILKNPSRFDFLVEKVTELGVREIVPMMTERSIPHHAKSDRWQKLALAAMKQSGRAFLPPVRQLSTIEEIAGSSNHAARFIAHEQANAESRLALPPESGSVLLLIGPEGGFTGAEVQACESFGCQPVSLGVRRLRTETAAIVGAALIIR